jgi:outer membrane immunogenic protein
MQAFGATMKIAARWVAATAFAALLVDSAGATDMNRFRGYTVRQPLNAYSWAGPYLGANLGYASGDISTVSARASGANAGVTMGYNFQSGAMIYGVEADLNGSGADGTFAGYKFSNPWFGTVRGRIGYALDNVLFYGTAGLAFGSLRAEVGGFNETQTSAGLTAGLGAEFGFAPNWSAKVEYLYVNLSDSRFTITGANHGYSFGLFRVGVNYRF